MEAHRSDPSSLEKGDQPMVGLERKQTLGGAKKGNHEEGVGKTTTTRTIAESIPMEELSEETETTRKVHESLGNPVRQTVRCEPFINFNDRPGETPWRRLRTDPFENHVAWEICEWFKLADGSDAEDIPRKENIGVVRHSFDVESDVESLNDLRQPD